MPKHRIDAHQHCWATMGSKGKYDPRAGGFDLHPAANGTGGPDKFSRVQNQEHFYIRTGGHKPRGSSQPKDRSSGNRRSTCTFINVQIFGGPHEARTQERG